MNISHIMKDRFGILILTLTKYIRYLSLRLIYQVQLREQGFDPSKAGVQNKKVRLWKWGIPNLELTPFLGANG